MRSFVCGETLCKRSFDAAVNPAKPWPIKCPACSRSLYPEEILSSTSLEELDPHRGPLMKPHGGKLTPVLRGELAQSAAEPKRSLLDEIVEEADAKAAGRDRPALRRGQRRYLVARALVALSVLGAVLWRLLR
ncbi:MAG: hypothetical protein U0414_44255 [Polyangiaceae bacterium]